MSTNFAIIGGDLRIIKLAKMLAKDGNKVYTYGLEKAEELKNEEGKDYLKYIWLDLDNINEQPILPQVVKEILK